MKAMDIRYNKEIIGGHVNGNNEGIMRDFQDDKERIVHYLSNHGCPTDYPYNYNGCRKLCNSSGCTKCWEQEVVNESN